MNRRLLMLLMKKYDEKTLSLEELEELRILLHREKEDIHETIAIRKFTFSY